MISVEDYLRFEEFANKILSDEESLEAFKKSSIKIDKWLHKNNNISIGISELRQLLVKSKIDAIYKKYI